MVFKKIIQNLITESTKSEGQAVKDEILALKARILDLAHIQTLYTSRETLEKNFNEMLTKSNSYWQEIVSKSNILETIALELVNLNEAERTERKLLGVMIPIVFSDLSDDEVLMLPVQVAILDQYSNFAEPLRIFKNIEDYQASDAPQSTRAMYGQIDQKYALRFEVRKK
jgi:hypothetical protein